MCGYLGEWRINDTAPRRSLVNEQLNEASAPRDHDVPSTNRACGGADGNCYSFSGGSPAPPETRASLRKFDIRGLEGRTASRDPAASGIEMYSCGNGTLSCLLGRKVGDHSSCNSESDYYLLIIAGRYGSTVPGESISYTHREYEYAKALGKPILAFIRKTESLLADRVEHEPNIRERLDRFREDVKAGILVKYWSSADELGWQVMSAADGGSRATPCGGLGQSI